MPNAKSTNDGSQSAPSFHRRRLCTESDILSLMPYLYSLVTHLVAAHPEQSIAVLGKICGLPEGDLGPLKPRTLSKDDNKGKEAENLKDTIGATLDAKCQVYKRWESKCPLLPSSKVVYRIRHIVVDALPLLVGYTLGRAAHPEQSIAVLGKICGLPEGDLGPLKPRTLSKDDNKGKEAENLKDTIGATLDAKCQVYKRWESKCPLLPSSKVMYRIRHIVVDALPLLVGYTRGRRSSRTIHCRAVGPWACITAISTEELHPTYHEFAITGGINRVRRCSLIGCRNEWEDMWFAGGGLGTVEAEDVEQR
ncbi:hypothetical protein ACHAWU_005112 [Discostella pseudostelligera]|uniref:Uncharacterized protein n=1 Tax=Discostella pseudostelligera TaxID=259834 RepID=A0ABD3LYM9_9STRA